MKVSCLANLGSALPNQYLNPTIGYGNKAEFRLTIGREYVVYALALRASQIWYYISDDADLYYPGHHPAPLFEVIDNRISNHWRYEFTQEPGYLHTVGFFAFQEWISEPNFYDKLTDKQEREVSIFFKMKELMDMEAKSNQAGTEQIE